MVKKYILCIISVCCVFLAACSVNKQFEGFYTNNGETERTKTIDKILECVESKSCASPLLKDGTTIGDIIYYYVEDPFDCFPSAEHPVYSVLFDVRGESVLGVNAYDVYYVIGVGNDAAIDLLFTVSYDLSEVVCREVTVRDLNSQQDYYSYWYEDHTQNVMDEALYATAAVLMPQLAEEVVEESTAQEVTGITEEGNVHEGIIRVDGLSCYLELEEPFVYRNPEPVYTITTKKLWLPESTVKYFVGYNGLKVSLRGELFNYRSNLETVMFDEMPIVESVSGTPDIIIPDAEYSNWSEETNETKFYDAIDILKLVLYRCENMLGVRVGYSHDEVQKIWEAEFADSCKIQISLNHLLTEFWLNDYGYEAYILPCEEFVEITLKDIGTENLLVWRYNWEGTLISDGAPLDEFIEEIIDSIV